MFVLDNVERNRRVGVLVLLLIGVVVGGVFLYSLVGIVGVLWIVVIIKVFMVVVWFFWFVEEEEEV